MAKPTTVPPTTTAITPETTGGLDFKAVLQQLVQLNASDLHLKVGRPPTLRLNGDLHPLAFAPLKPEDLKKLGVF